MGPGVCDSLGRSPAGALLWNMRVSTNSSTFFQDFEDPETEEFSQVRDSDLGRYFTACARPAHPEVIASWRISCQPALRIYSGMCEGGPMRTVTCAA